jgi:gluconokinase
MIVVLIGVTGSGKTTVGKVLANQLGWKFVDGTG